MEADLQLHLLVTSGRAGQVLCTCHAAHSTRKTAFELAWRRRKCTAQRTAFVAASTVHSCVPCLFVVNCKEKNYFSGSCLRFRHFVCVHLERERVQLLSTCGPFVNHSWFSFWLHSDFLYACNQGVLHRLLFLQLKTVARNLNKPYAVTAARMRHAYKLYPCFSIARTCTVIIEPQWLLLRIHRDWIF